MCSLNITLYIQCQCRLCVVMRYSEGKYMFLLIVEVNCTDKDVKLMWMRGDF